MSRPIHDYDHLYDYLGVSAPTEIILEPIDMATVGSGSYVARSGNRRVYVGRLVAVQLRRDGACWRGDIVRDPCAVA